MPDDLITKQEAAAQVEAALAAAAEQVAAAREQGRRKGRRDALLEAVALLRSGITDYETHAEREFLGQVAGRLEEMAE
jgi:hypothetical protein